MPGRRALSNLLNWWLLYWLYSSSDNARHNWDCSLWKDGLDTSWSAQRQHRQLLCSQGLSGSPSAPFWKHNMIFWDIFIMLHWDSWLFNFDLQVPCSVFSLHPAAQPACKPSSSSPKSISGAVNTAVKGTSILLSGLFKAISLKTDF